MHPFKNQRKLRVTFFLFFSIRDVSHGSVLGVKVIFLKVWGKADRELLVRMLGIDNSPTVWHILALHRYFHGGPSSHRHYNVCSLLRPRTMQHCYVHDGPSSHRHYNVCSLLRSRIMQPSYISDWTEHRWAECHSHSEDFTCFLSCSAYYKSLEWQYFEDRIRINSLIMVFLIFLWCNDNGLKSIEQGEISFSIMGDLWRLAGVLQSRSFVNDCLKFLSFYEVSGDTPSNFKIYDINDFSLWFLNWAFALMAWFQFWKYVFLLCSSVWRFGCSAIIDSSWGWKDILNWLLHWKIIFFWHVIDLWHWNNHGGTFYWGCLRSIWKGSSAYDSHDCHN